MTHLYYGDGKGKTTAALGLAVRAAGCGWSVIFVQFLKSLQTGELASLEKLGISVYRGKGCDKFSFQMTDEEKRIARAIATDHLLSAWRLAQSGRCDLLVLDEAVWAYGLNLVDQALLEEIVKNRPQRLELVLTGRNPPSFMLEHSDYVTEMKKIRHPYDENVKARRGVEY